MVQARRVIQMEWALASALLLRAFVAVTLVLADADTTESVDEVLRLFGVCVLCVSCPCFGSRV